MKRARYRVGLVLLALCVAGCAAPEIAMPRPVEWTPRPTGRTEPGGQELEKQVPVHLATVIRLANDRPLELALARAQASAAKAAEQLAYSQWLPTLRPRITLSRHAGQIQDTGGAFLDVDKQSAFAGGGVDVGVQLAEAWFAPIAAEQRARAAELGVHTAQHVQVGAAVEHYYDLLQASATVQVAEQVLAHARELVRVQEQEQHAGRGLPADVARAKAFRAGAEGRVAVARAQVTETNARLSGLLMLKEDTELVPTETQVLPIDFGEATESLPQLLRRALAQRPDVRSAKAAVAAADADRSQATWSWLLPELHAGADYGTFGHALTSGEGREDYYADMQWSWSFGAAANSRSADARLQAERVREQMLTRDVRTELQIAVAAVVSAKARMAAAGEEVAAADTAVQLVTARQRQGKVLILEVLDAEQAGGEARINLVRAVCAQNRAQFRLHRLLGGDPG